MIYGLYLSASGIMTSSHKQDVIANNLANSETAGFKRDIPLFQQRLTEADERRRAGGPSQWSDPSLENLGGGMFVSPTAPDMSQGDMEHTGDPLDVAIEGDGYFAVRSKSASPTTAGNAEPALLTRNGQFMVDRQGFLVMGNEAAQQVLDINQKPIHVNIEAGKLNIGADGTLNQGEKPIGRIGVFTVADKSKLAKQGGTIIGYPDAGGLKRSDAVLHGGVVERSNVDPTTELTELMKAQRQLEANANMIKVQDQTLQKLVNDVGKIS